MNLQGAKIILDNINSSKLETLKNDLIESCIKYSRIRVDWYLSDLEGKKEMELKK